MSQSLHLLHIEDCLDDNLLIVHHLEKAGFEVTCHRIETEGAMQQALAAFHFDLVLSDHSLPRFSSLKALEVIKRNGLISELPFIVVSGAIGEQAVVEALKAGAHDFVDKNDLTRLVPAIQRERREAQVRKERLEFEQQLIAANRDLRDALDTIAETQSHLVRSERLKVMGEMASGIAHDFNNVLSKMLGIVELMELESGEQPPSTAQLKTLIGDGTSVVRRLMAFYKDHEHDGELGAMDLGKVIDQSVELTRPRWRDQSQLNGRPIEVCVDGKPESLVQGDEPEMREALTNLLFNAFDAMPEGGKVTISGETTKDSVVIHIADTGMGMTEEVKERCLEPFYTTKGDHGTGLGLSSVANIIKRFGGSLSIESAPGEGTRISILLPLYQGEALLAGEEDEVPDEDSKESLRVLLADDDPIIAQITEKFLLFDGHEVEVVTNGCLALERLRNAGSSFDLVITDRSMPEMCGDELAIRAKELTGLPVIMVTGFGDMMLNEGEKPQGVDYLLSKPISRKDLHEAIQFVLYPQEERPGEAVAA